MKTQSVNENSILLALNESACKQCGICVAECPHHKTKGETRHVDHSFEYCDKCQHCYSVCPQHAIEIVPDGITGSWPAIDPELFLRHLMYRRSYRRFKSGPIPRKVMDTLLDAARFIPSGGNDHRFQITLLTSDRVRQELLKSIHRYYSRLLRLMRHPLVKELLKLIGDPKVKATLREPENLKKIIYAINMIHGEDDAVFYNAPAVLFFHTDRIMPTAGEDCLLSAYNIALQAETLGLGSCFVSLSQQAVNENKKCKQLLSIPPNHFVYAVLVLGYPVRKYLRPAVRPKKEVSYA